MNETPGQRLQAARKAAGLRRQADLAEQLGVSEKTVRNWETDAYPIPAAQLALIRRVLPAFDEEDAVLRAIAQSPLEEWRRDRVRSEYRHQLLDQSREEAAQ